VCRVERSYACCACRNVLCGCSTAWCRRCPTSPGGGRWAVPHAIGAAENSSMGMLCSRQDSRHVFACRSDPALHASACAPPAQPSARMMLSAALGMPMQPAERAVLPPRAQPGQCRGRQGARISPAPLGSVSSLPPEPLSIL